MKDSWKARSLRSGFGIQCLASKPSSPAAGFGSSNRDAYLKVALPKHVGRLHCISLKIRQQSCWRTDSIIAAAEGRGPVLLELYSMHPVMISSSSCSQMHAEREA